jgi:uncharacterized protein (DUF2126 family)
MPPVERVEDYLELVAAAEAAAPRAGPAGAHRGLRAANDPRLNVIRVAPDPGVIEVNIHPASSWRECVATTTASTRRRADAPRRRQVHDRRPPHRHRRRQPRRGRRRHADGQPVPAPAGPAEEPDPATGRTTPSLSYLFSGLFIGPTSQAPRIDEARHDSSTSWRSRSRRSRTAGAGSRRRPGWSTACLRNLLIDVTGNTHRAEICIDKLYSPDGPTGRLGLVEFRGFEMPPDPRMSLAQQVLMRASSRASGKTRSTGPARALGHAAARPLHAAALRVARPAGRAADLREARLRRAPRVVTRRRPSSASPSAARSILRGACSSNSVRRSSPGTCSARRAPSAAPCATSTAPWSGCR